MKKICFLLFCGLLFACGDKKSSEKAALTQLDFKLDTLLIDAGEEFFYLRDNLWLSDLSHDGRFLFNYNRTDAVMEKIDLDQGVLVKKIQFEKEGPDGIGDFISNFSLTADEQFIAWFYGLSKIFTQEAKVARDLKLDKLLAADFSEYDIYPMSIFESPDDPNRFFGFYVRWSDMSYYLMDFDLENESFRKIEIQDMNKIMDFSTDLLYDGQKMGSMGSGAYALSKGNQIVVYNNCFNEVYIYDAGIDSLYRKGLESPLLGDKKTYLPPKEVEGESNQQWEVERKQREDINFGSIHWDRQNQRFFRLSFKEKFGEEMTERRGYQPIGAEVFLSVFDQDFNLIAESLVPNLNQRPAKQIVKDGQIWIFENMDDEIAFLRLEILDK
ncbi:DUF4221 family protein [Cecembia sp.]|uniref:DUF4221 family protein n=1 Tax=Cecembia sp. TaxID=1898110 RepID=UPI0025BEA717|nr:DUF4221 family protein [Cecembia sp.]